MGFLKSPCSTSYKSWSSIDTIALKCLVFEKIAFFCVLATERQTDKQTDEQMDSTDALSRSRCRERRLNNKNKSDNFYRTVTCRQSVTVTRARTSPRTFSVSYVRQCQCLYMNRSVLSLDLNDSSD